MARSKRRGKRSNWKSHYRKNRGRGARYARRSYYSKYGKSGGAKRSGFLGQLKALGASFDKAAGVRRKKRVAGYKRRGDNAMRMLHASEKAMWQLIKKWQHMGDVVKAKAAKRAQLRLARAKANLAAMQEMSKSGVFYRTPESAAKAEARLKKAVEAAEKELSNLGGSGVFKPKGLLTAAGSTPIYYGDGVGHDPSGRRRRKKAKRRGKKARRGSWRKSTRKYKTGTSYRRGGKKRSSGRKSWSKGKKRSSARKSWSKGKKRSAKKSRRGLSAKAHAGRARYLAFVKKWTRSGKSLKSGQAAWKRRKKSHRDL